jgi:23S rRNA pseudouridine955/2504/2580 synthase
LNKGRAQAESRLEEGDVLRLPPVRVSDKVDVKAAAMAQDTPANQAHRAAALGMKVLFEDEALMAVVKPAGVAVHGGSGVSFGVIEQLRMARPQAKFLELVHRLDRDTSGILLIAKKRSALKALQDQFRDRETGKTYLALAVGNWPANKKVLDKPLFKFEDEAVGGERRVKVVSRDDPAGMKSITLVKVRQRSAPSTNPAAPPPFSLLEVTIKTGRTHQIRVHLAAEGMPIAGDDKYGVFELNKALEKTRPVPLKRMFLHAWALQFNHPVSAERVHLMCPLPPELQAFADQVLLKDNLLEPAPPTI